MAQPTIFRIDTPIANGEFRTTYVASPTLADVQRLVFGTNSLVAVVLHKFKETVDYSLPDEYSEFKQSLIA